MSKERLKPGKLYTFINNRKVVRFIVALKFPEETRCVYYAFLGPDGAYQPYWYMYPEEWEEVETDING